MKKERTEKLKELLNKYIEIISSDCFDNQDRYELFQQATKVLSMIHDLNKAL